MTGVVIPKFTIHFAKFMTCRVYGPMMRLEMWAREHTVWLWVIALALMIAAFAIFDVWLWRLAQIVPIT